MLKIKSKGDFSKATRWLVRVKDSVKNMDLDRFGRAGVDALASATPVDTGKTAASWEYTIERKDGRVSIIFKNTNIQNGIPVAVILQYGHATKNGGWVEGIDYINPAVRPIFENIAQEAWKEVTK